VPALVALTVAASACSSTPTASTTTTGGGAASATGEVQATATPTLPAVTGAGNTDHEPSIGAGTSPAPTQLQTRDLVTGTGTAAALTSTVKVQYVGANYATGKDFDASWTDNGPATFSLNQVVPGFAQGISGMKVGGWREIVIPPALGYGAGGQPPAVGPNETLVFVVDLIAVQ